MDNVWSAAIMKKTSIKIGDIFCVKIDDNYKMYFQYVADDLTQLNSAVIRVFKDKYSQNENLDFDKVVQGDISFYAHTVLKWGIKLGFWEKVGNCTVYGGITVLFRSSGDDGNLQIKISENWWVWHVNEEQEHVGKLTGENRFAEIGSVIPADSIVHRMKTGKYDFVYPKFEQ